MRTRLGWLVAVLGVLCALAGLAIMVILGPDSRFTTGPHAVKTDGIAVVTAPKVISWADVRVDVLAEVPVKKPIFVGLGNSVDVQNYVSKTARLEVTGFHTPWKPKTRVVAGRPGLPGAPTALDWWLADSAGLGGASISTTLPDQTVSLAILSVGASNLSGLKVSIAYGVKGGFAKGVGLLLLGLGGVWLSLLLRRGRSMWADEDAVDEEVVYVYVDDDGVEHELSADEAKAYDVVEETVEEVPVVEAPEPEAVQEPEPEPEPEPVQEPEPESAQPPAATEKVVYVFVDEDGVEHELELSEEELADFEIVDEEES
jgi:hypothetical protein